MAQLSEEDQLKQRILSVLHLDNSVMVEHVEPEISKIVDVCRQYAEERETWKTLRDDAADLKCSICWRTPTKIFRRIFYCSEHFQDEYAHSPLSNTEKEE